MDKTAEEVKTRGINFHSTHFLHRSTYDLESKMHTAHSTDVDTGIDIDDTKLAQKHNRGKGRGRGRGRGRN